MAPGGIIFIMKYFTWARVSTIPDNIDVSKWILEPWRQYERYIEDHPELHNSFDVRLLDPMFLHDGYVSSIRRTIEGTAWVTFLMPSGEQCILRYGNVKSVVAYREPTAIIDKLYLQEFDVGYAECLLGESAGIVEHRLIDMVGIYLVVESEYVAIEEA